MHNIEMKIFISSRMNGEVDEERRLVISILEKTAKLYSLNIKIISFEEALYPSTTTTEASLHLVGMSNVFVGIYYKSITDILKREFNYANDRNYPIFIFRKRLEISAVNERETMEYEKLKSFLTFEARHSTIHGKKDSYVYRYLESSDIEQILTRLILLYYPKMAQRQIFHEKYILDEYDQSKLEQINRVYVKPNNLQEVIENTKKYNLCTILGPAHIGKTSTTMYLAEYFRKKMKLTRIIKFPAEGKYYEIDKCMNSVIIIDDAFGSTQYDINYNIVSQIERIMSLTSMNNYIFLNSREEILITIMSKTRICENYQIINNSIRLYPKSYDLKKTEEMVVNHMSLYGISKFKNKPDNKAIRYISKELFFPHNIDLFLHHASFDPEMLNNLKASIGQFKAIKTVVSSWFNHFHETNLTVFYAVYYLAFLSELDWKDFVDCYNCLSLLISRKKKMKLSKLHYDELAKIYKETSPYIVSYNKRKLVFDHPSYKESVIDSVLNLYKHDIEDVVDELFVCSLSDKLDGCGTAKTLPYYFYIVSPDKITSKYLELLNINWTNNDFIANIIFNIGLKDVEMLFKYEKILDNNNYMTMNKYFEVLTNIGKYFPEIIIEHFFEILNSDDDIRKSQIIVHLAALYKSNYKYVLKSFENILKNPDWIVRKSFALSLRRVICIYPLDIIPLLQELANDSEWLVRNAAENTFEYYYKNKNHNVTC